METVAVYFPSYHRDPLNDRWYGEGWSEWRLMEQARPLFPGHEQPKLCTWGSFDEADPAWMEKQIDLAADHGITSFLFDWYWYSGQKFMHRALEEGFLKARNRHRLKFFAMWANHTWGVFPACREIFRGHHPSTPHDLRLTPHDSRLTPHDSRLTPHDSRLTPHDSRLTPHDSRLTPHDSPSTTSEGQALAYDKPLLEIKHTQADLLAVAEYCAEHYFHESNYHCVDGKPIFSFWRWEELEIQLGGVAGVAAGFEAMRAVARRHGFPGLHIMVNIACYENDQTLHCWWPKLVERIKEAGGDSVYGYNVSRTHGFNALTDAYPVASYEDVLQSHRELIRLCENRGLPFHPVATVGFDNTPRWHRGATLPVDFRKLHYEPIVVGNTPERFGEAVRIGLESIRRCGGGDRMLLVNAWNEWTEGCYLLPDQRHGNGFLEALRDEVSRGL
jgi:hypothetical protein